jgi:hypothetical protein
MIYDEIIIGSGIAGLYWIYKTKPTNYLILEKNNRIGGRIYNIDWNNSQISLGGGIIKSNNTYTIKLITELGLTYGDSISKYHFIDLENNKSNINKPNENNFYKYNKIIIKYLKQIYKKNYIQITNEKLNFEQFLDLFLDLKISKIIKSNLLYKTYFDSDVKSVLEDEIDELLRTEDFHIKFIKNGGYGILLSKLIEIVKPINIKINNEVTEISKKNNIFQIKINNGKIYNSKKIILATESETKINYKFNDITNNLISKLYNLVSGSKYIRVYTYHKESHGLECSYKTIGLPGKVIVINKNILMCCYTEDLDAIKLFKLLSNKTNLQQIDIIYNLLINSNIPITKPDDIIIKFWETGIHYNNPGYNKEYKNELIKKLKKENIFVIGEAIADSHGWVNSALESVDSIL